MERNTDGNSIKHPYSDYENTPLWNVISKSIAELEENQDIKLSTRREYVIGFIASSSKRVSKTTTSQTFLV